MSSLRFAKLEDRPEIFETIQGEGKSIGSPAVFARLSGCNLQCVWCDTPYTWNWDGTKFAHNDGTKYDRLENSVSVSIGEAVDQITESSVKRVVITGGEPLLQQTSIINLVDELKARDPEYRFEVETNGTIAPTPEMIDRIDQFNVSPKLQSSGMPKEKRRKDKSLSVFSKLATANFKFVIGTDDDLEEALDYIADYQMPVENVYLMPQGVSEQQVADNTKRLVDIATQVGCNVTTRLHILIWGAKRGV